MENAGQLIEDEELRAQIKGSGIGTSATRAEILKKLVEEKKIDYVAMDIKNAPSRYGETAGVKKIDVMRINESVEFLKSGVVDYECRTTL